MTSTPDPVLIARANSPTHSGVRHLYQRSTGDSDDDGVTALCDETSRQFHSSFEPSLKYVDPDHDAAADDVCDACLGTDAYAEFREQYPVRTPRSDRTSRWEKYQEWIDARDWDDTSPDSPEEALANGNVLTVLNTEYTGPYAQKTHAYRPVGDRYQSFCGNTNPQTAPVLSSLSPSEFVSRSNSCQRCIEIAGLADKPRLSNAATVNYDPFGVFQHDSTLDDLPELPDDPEDYVCPGCGKSYGPDGIGQHWGHPQSDCEYPVPSTDEQSLLIGLWLVGGSIEQQGTYPMLRKTSIRQYTLEWLKHELGVWGVDVTESNTHEEQKANIETGFGYENAGSNQQYRLTTRTCPFLADLQEADLGDVELTSRAARVLFSFRGSVIDESAISLRHPDGEGLVALLHDAGFTETSLYEPPTGKNQWTVTLSAEDSRRFADWIGGDPLPGVTSPSKQLAFRDCGPQGEPATRRVTPEQSTESTATPGTPETVSLEPDWEWLGVCLAQLGQPALARRALDQTLSPAEVYGDILDDIYAHRDELPTPSQVAADA